MASTLTLSGRAALGVSLTRGADHLDGDHGRGDGRRGLRPVIALPGCGTAFPPGAAGVATSGDVRDQSEHVPAQGRVSGCRDLDRGTRVVFARSVSATLRPGGGESAVSGYFFFSLTVREIWR